MIPRPTLALAFALLAANAAHADDAPAKSDEAAPTEQAKPADAEKAGRNFFAKLDVNGDGKLELKEIPEQARPRLEPLFRRIGKTTITAAEFDKVRGQERGSDAEDDRARFFDLLDRNGDGKLTHAEVPEKAKRLVAALLERAGKPADGALSKTEYVAVLDGKVTAGTNDSPTAAPGLVGVLDADADGKLSKAELAQAAAKFDELDANGDGVLETSELIGTTKAAAGDETGETEYARKVFKELDADGDGFISKTEAPELVREAFDQLDLDENGLSFEEFIKAIAKNADDEATESSEEPADATE